MRSTFSKTCLFRFDVLRVAAGSYTVELKRIASRKLFKRVPGLQDVKNGPKRTKIIENRKNWILPELSQFPSKFPENFFPALFLAKKTF